jgi:hypothetical protein
MQQKGRDREDGTIIVGESLHLESLGLVRGLTGELLSDGSIVACTDPRVTPEEFLCMDARTSRFYLPFCKFYCNPKT